MALADVICENVFLSKVGSSDFTTSRCRAGAGAAECVLMNRSTSTKPSVNAMADEIARIAVSVESPSLRISFSSCSNGCSELAGTALLVTSGIQ